MPHSDPRPRTIRPKSSSFAAPLLRADVLHFKDGTSLTGTILKETNSEITIKTSGGILTKKKTYIINVADYGPSAGGRKLHLYLCWLPPDDRKGKISRNIYRIPYDDGEEPKVLTAYVSHCEPLFQTAHSGMTPADELLAAYEGRWGGSVDPVFQEYVY